MLLSSLHSLPRLETTANQGQANYFAKSTHTHTASHKNNTPEDRDFQSPHTYTSTVLADQLSALVPRNTAHREEKVHLFHSLQIPAWLHFECVNDIDHLSLTGEG